MKTLGNPSSEDTCGFVTTTAYERLERENAKLREQVHWLKKGNVLHVFTNQDLADQQRHEREMHASITALYDENAKLRELMHDMLRWMPCPTHCYHCERYHYPEGCEFEIRWRELGIEVKS